MEKTANKMRISPDHKEIMLSPAYKVLGREWEFEDDFIAGEILIELIFNNRPLLTLSCSPGLVKELVYGYLLNKGFLSSFDDIASTNYDEEEGVIYVKSKDELKIHGLPALEPIDNDFQFTHQELMDYFVLLDEFEKPLCRPTAGFYSGAIGWQGSLHLPVCDVNSQSVLFKMRGIAAVENKPAPAGILLFSDRVCADIILDAAKMGIPVVASCGAPSSLAISYAEKLNITLIGFVRNNKMYIYSNDWRWK
ncbi:MAG: formate dehydrogenase accessory sulfurtransferase FdhD [Clostridiales bacterium]